MIVTLQYPVSVNQATLPGEGAVPQDQYGQNEITCI